MSPEALIRIEAATAGNSMAYDSIGSIASALSGYSLTLVETRRACPGLVSWLRPGAYPIASGQSGVRMAASRQSNRHREDLQATL